MKFLVVLAVAIMGAHAHGPSERVVRQVSKFDEAAAPIVKSAYEQTPEGNFQYSYETGNGIYNQASGVVKNPTSEYASLAVSGAVKYNAPDGTPVELSYVADEEGYKPVGSHLPVSPPIPELIARSLAYIAANPPKPEFEKPAYKPPTPNYG